MLSGVEPCHDIAHLAHVELLTPRLDESLRFFLDVMGMQETARVGDSVYLRGWDDYEHHSLKLSASKKPGIGHFAFRATSPAALKRRADALEATGLGVGWTDGDVGHGPAYLARDPDGHQIEIYYETESVQAAGGAQAGAEKPGGALFLERDRRAPPRPSQSAGQ